MKPINEMTLAECLEEVKLLNGVYEYDSPIRLALRINELTRWIPVGERLPTRKDADSFGYVWVSAMNVATGDRAHDSWLWVEVTLDGGIAYKPTHWRRIDKP